MLPRLSKFVDLSEDDEGNPIIECEEGKARKIEELIELMPAITHPGWAPAFATMATYLEHVFDYEVIKDPEAFKAEYMATYNAEDPEEEVGPGVIRLHNFGIPDFAVIHPPESRDGVLVFYATNVFMGIPYKATMTIGQPLLLEPVRMV